MLRNKSDANEFHTFDGKRYFTIVSHSNTFWSEMWSRDKEDITKLRARLHELPPFLDMKEVGKFPHSTGNRYYIHNKDYGPNFRLKRKVKVSALASINCSLNVADEKIIVERSCLLFGE